MKKNITKKKKGSKVFNIVFSIIVLAGIVVVSYPTVSNWWNQQHASHAIATYIEEIEKIDDGSKQAYIDEAKAFNAKLGTGVDFNLSDEMMAEYENLLDVSGNGVMGYINIPSISVNLPIYHGVDDTILQVAIGHIPGSSLPVGGEGTHAVLSGHRGLPSAMLFTDLDRLAEGDIFTVTVLDEVVTYQVDQIRIVLPEDVADLAIVEGQDYMTLVTCTPYGVNSHRLLVRGKRIDNLVAEKILKIEADAVRISPVKVIFGIAIPLIILTMIISLWQGNYMAITRKSSDLILEDLEKMAPKDIGGNEDEK